MTNAPLDARYHRPMRHYNAGGFTLIEVIIAMVIIAVLAAIALPNYTAYVQRSNRTDARSQMLQTAQWMERWRTERGRYDDPANAGNPPPTFPNTLKCSPSNASGTNCKYYTLALDTLAAGTFRVTATPVTGSSMDGDGCGTYTLDQTGARTSSGGDDICWNR